MLGNRRAVFLLVQLRHRSISGAVLEVQAFFQSQILSDGLCADIRHFFGKQLLQRRFRIGYTRAARLMDALEDAGIIGPPTGTSTAREGFGEGGAAATADEAEEPDAPDENEPS